MIQTINRFLGGLILASLAFQTHGNAYADEIEPAAIRVQDESVWVGQRAAFFVELRAPGSFVGAASFSLPAISQTIIVKTGNPVVSSKQLDGQTYFVQTHRFALFSQAGGTLDIPSFAVRFRHRDGFTGPALERRAMVPSATLQVRRPPQSEQLGFLIATSRFEVDQSWDPEPGAAEQGAIVKRTISQQADEMTGMALFPPPTQVPDGVRIYSGRPEVSDNTERGNLNGRRRDTLTYVFEQPGTVTLPAMEYVWWDPQQSQFFSKTLPAATFEIVATPANDRVESTSDFPSALVAGIAFGVLVLGVLVLGAIVWRRGSLVAWVVRCWNFWYPADHHVAKQLLRACSHGDATAAESAWNRWRSHQPPDEQLPQPLLAAVGELHRFAYGRATRDRWEGAALERAFRQHLASRSQSTEKSHHRALPRLNPATGD